MYIIFILRLSYAWFLDLSNFQSPITLIICNAEYHVRGNSLIEQSQYERRFSGSWMFNATRATESVARAEWWFFIHARSHESIARAIALAKRDLSPSSTHIVVCRRSGQSRFVPILKRKVRSSANRLFGRSSMGEAWNLHIHTYIHVHRREHFLLLS